MEKQDRQRASQLRIYRLAFHACWLLIAAIAAHRRFSLPPAPFLDRDIWGYLSPALLKLSGGAFIQSAGRAFVYPGFLYLTLAAFRNFDAITVIQHLLGLGAGLLLLANWTVGRRLLPKPAIPRAIHDLLGLGLLAIFLFSTQAISYEHFLRPEAVCPFFAALGFFLTVRFLVAKHVEHDARRIMAYGIASLSVALLLPMLKPSYWLTAVLTTLPVTLHLFDRQDQLWRRLTIVAVPILLASALLWYPEKQYSDADPGGQYFLDQSLFTIHAPQIREQMARDLAANTGNPPCSRPQLQAALTLLGAELAISRASGHHFAVLGFDPDYLLYEDSFCRKLSSILPEREERRAFCRYYFRRTWQEQPGAMLAKIGRQIGLFYNGQCPVYTSRTTSCAKHYTEAATLLQSEAYNRLIVRVGPAQQYLEAVSSLTASRAAVVQPDILKAVLTALASTYLAGLLLFLGVGVWLLVNAADRTRCGLLFVLVALGYAYNLGNNLSIAIFHTLGIGRYSHVQFATTLLVQFQTLLLLGEVLAPKIWRLFFRQKAPSV